jgi:predicted nucleotidyltransferase
MASKKTLNAANLEALGAERLAALLIEVSQGNAAIKRRLRLELVGEQSPAELAKEVRKRLATIARSRSFVDWQSRKGLVDDLEVQRRAIVQQVAKRSPSEALELLWQFLDLARSVFERTDDSSGTISGVFHAAVADLGDIAQAAKPDPKQLGDQVSRALVQNDYGQYDNLVPVLQLALGPAGLEHLKQRMIALSTEPVRKPAAKERQVIGWASTGPIYADEIAERSRDSTVRLALQDIADAQGDVDAYIAQYEPEVRKVPKIAAEIAKRLLAAGRAAEASQTIEATEHRERGWPDFEWEDARIEVLEAIGRSDEAQAARWSCFERSLSARHLRDYLKRLPDFDGFEAEQQALDYAERYGSLLTAVSFLVSWPALDRAARLVTERAKELDGDHYEILTPAADALAGKYPVAATLLLRAMIDFALTQSRSSRYGHAARHLRDCAGLASAISGYGSFETHDAYVSRLRRDHGRKTAFWNMVD